MSEKRVGRPKGRKTMVTKNQVYSIILERFLGNPPKPTSKKQVERALGTTWPIVNGHFDNLIDDKMIELAENGYYFPAYIFEDRAVSVTAGHGIRFKAECGDQLIELSPREFEKLIAMGRGLIDSERRRG